ncbi:MAG: SDR family NAD(P)-dependent oxidoreductase [Treponema sp.]|jgi:NAD(P)-dependent dehydrogenase (short-subunit alcohol dehydrogenase family)|nr:SDR family NAD(P)-dependent oxidoreductase [Treponema sp.]
MKKTALVSCIDTAFGETLATIFAREGFRVFALGAQPLENVTLLSHDPYEAAAALKEKSGKLDFLLDTTDVCSPKDTFTVRDGINRAVVEQVYRQNVLASMALLEAFLPLLDQGEGKRLFYLTRAQASVNETRRVNHFAYNMSKAALHQFIQMTRNKLAPKGYTFRVFDPLDGEVTPEAAAESAYNYITRRRGTENHDPLRDDEDNLVFRDAQGRQHSW